MLVTVLLCSGVYLLVPPCNAPHDPEDFDISIRHSVHPDLHSARPGYAVALPGSSSLVSWTMIYLAAVANLS
jgi:hypothetical protein